MNLDMRPCGVVIYKSYKKDIICDFKLCVHWYSGCQHGKYIAQGGDWEVPALWEVLPFKHRYLLQRLSYKVSWFSESRHLLLVRSKIRHILAGLGPPDGRASVNAEPRIYPGSPPFVPHSLNQVKIWAKVEVPRFWNQWTGILYPLFLH